MRWEKDFLRSLSGSRHLSASLLQLGVVMSPVERASGGTSAIDVLDRVLDKGIVIDAWVRVSLVGIDLITVEARVVVASIATYLQYSEPVAEAGAASRGTDGWRPPLAKAS